ncbi:MAG: hypothetical protein NTX27_05370 [Verrucomicrobia bacterium]|jgi:hypothetical protein|nr:hypothetical protein [Verrucomicrobiota bacterium]
MFENFTNLFSKKPAGKGGPMVREAYTTQSPLQQTGSERNKQVYSRVFRWRLPAGQTEEPDSVDIVGSFTHWQKVPLIRDSILDAWHVTLHHIQGNRTHHYMMLVDGLPVYDKSCDGLAVPHGHDEERFQLDTDKGPRVLMLFGQTK